jgi:hypothetical protein
MTRGLVVSSDLDTLSREIVALRTCGYEVVSCPGPAEVDCPVLRGRACPRAERADVLLYDRDVAEAPHGDRILLTELRELYADKPLILAEPDRALPLADRLVDDGLWRVLGAPGGEGLELTLEEALGDR